MSRERFALLLLVGCTGRTATSELVANLDVLTREHRLEMTVSLGIKGHMTSLGLEQYAIEPDEHVSVGYADQSVELLFNDDPQNGVYRPYWGTLPLPDPLGADEEVWLSLDRGGGDVTRIATAPPPPVIIQAPATTPRTSDLTVQWSPTWSAPMTWHAFSDATDSSYGPIPQDTGTLTIPRDVVATFCSPYGCPITFTLEREAFAQPDSAFASGRIDVDQVGYAQIMVTP